MEPAGCRLGGPGITAAGDVVALCVAAQVEPATWGAVAGDRGCADRRAVIRKSATVRQELHGAWLLLLPENHSCNHGSRKPQY